MGLKLTKMEIENFRSFHGVQFNVGRKITAISGQNGVGKSSITSLMASGSGLSKKGRLGSNFQPEFYDFFNIDLEEKFTDYRLFLTYTEEGYAESVLKKLSFKDDTEANRGVRIIPRTSNRDLPGVKLKIAEKMAKDTFGVGGAARVPIPTIYLSISRLYPLGERKDTVTIKELKRTNKLYQNETDHKFCEWYNAVIPGSIKQGAPLSVVEKKTCSRSSFHMDIEHTPTLSQSVGQDNIGNIISALVDIYLLSKQENYAGAILCIDEVEVSLHPDTQIRLLDLLYKLSDELSIQIIFSTHSLTVLKELLRKQEKSPKEYSVIYLKNPSAPIVTRHKSYEMLKADLLGRMTFDRPRTKIYFEDEIGQHLFHLLVSSLRHQCDILSRGNDLRNCEEVNLSYKLKNSLEQLKEFVDVLPDLQEIVMHLGCTELQKIAEKDKSYFQRVIFILDGDARYREVAQKPHVNDYLMQDFDPTGKNDVSHEQNICFLPGPFAPESFLYQIIYRLSNKESDHMMFWRALDECVETSLYTASKIRNMFDSLPKDFRNDDLKKIFKDYCVDRMHRNSEIWQFVDNSHLLEYYYEDYKNVDELIVFFRNFKKAYDMAHAKTLANRFG